MLLFITTYLLTLPALLIIFALGILFSNGECDEWAVFTSIAAATIAFFMYDIKINYIILFGIVYFIVGVIWSFWRYRRHVENIVDIINVSTSNYGNKSMIEGLELKNMVGKITTWILTWPFSMVENIIGDVIRFFKTFITEYLKSVYNGILESAKQKIKPLKESERK